MIVNMTAAGQGVMKKGMSYWHIAPMIAVMKNPILVKY